MMSWFRLARRGAGAAYRQLFPTPEVASWRHADALTRTVPRFTAGSIRMLDYELKYLDLLSFCPQWHDIFIDGALEFHAGSAAPRILDCGGNVAAVTTALRPSERDYFVLKPKHSAFYATPLALLLRDLQVRRLIVCGVASDQCVMSSVAEARMRDIDVVVPRDCVASQTHQRNDVALQQFAEVFKLKTPLARRLALPS